MSDMIRLLPDHVANQIAAGEVVQRPASVVKELLDNSIDAGATEITLIIKEAGKLLIQVNDNGKGMSPADARMCWERHATSKITRVEDLFRLRTMGFRGEALASIAAVAQVEMKTRSASEELGTLLVIEGSEVLRQEPAQTPAGTQIQVKNLFFNVPARRNFLKSNPVETRHIISEFTRAALSHPQLHLRMYHNDSEVYNLTPASLPERILQLFPEKKAADLIAVEEETSILRISGFVGTPASARKTRDEQFFFVNNRYIKDAYLNHAVNACYEQLISKEQFPFYLIHIDIDPKEIDVNIHPTKTEIKFQDERSVYTILKSVIKKALGDFYVVPLYDGSSAESFIPATPLQPGEITRAPEIRAPRPVNVHVTGTPSYRRDTTYGWEKLFVPAHELPETSSAVPDTLPLQPTEEVTVLGSPVQLFGSYVLCGTSRGTLLLDQQAAHERVLYEQYMHAAEHQRILCQQKLFPRVVQLSSADYELMEELVPELQLMGFDVSGFGNNNMIVHGVPADLHQANEEELMAGILEDLKQNTANNTANRRERLAWFMARRAAVHKHRKLSEEEMRNLLSDLFRTQQPAYTPSGKKTYVVLLEDDLLRLFI
jgi:DNA mismatch repair protein MutL